MRPAKYDIDLPDVDPNGICEDQTTAGAADLVLNGALCDLGTAGQFDIGDSYTSGVNGVVVAMESSADLSGVNFTFTYKDQYGGSQTVTHAGPNATTQNVQDASGNDIYMSQITNIAVDGAVGTNVEIGTVDQVTAGFTIIDWRDDEPFTTAIMGLSGTIQFDIQESFDNASLAASVIGVMDWRDTQSNKTANLSAETSRHARAVRLVVDSYSSAAELQFHVIGGSAAC